MTLERTWRRSRRCCRAPRIRTSDWTTCWEPSGSTERRGRTSSAHGRRGWLAILGSLLAARLAQLDRLIVYSVTQSGVLDYESGVSALRSLLAASSLDPAIADLLQQVEERGYLWGVSDGN